MADENYIDRVEVDGVTRLLRDSSVSELLDGCADRGLTNTELEQFPIETSGICEFNAGSTATRAAYGAGKYVAVKPGTNQCAYLIDGSTEWKTATLPTTANWCAVAYGPCIGLNKSAFVAITSDSALVAYSADGITWTLVEMDRYEAGTTLSDIAYFAPTNGFIVISDNTAKVGYLNVVQAAARTSWQTIESESGWTNIVATSSFAVVYKAAGENDNGHTDYMWSNGYAWQYDMLSEEALGGVIRCCCVLASSSTSSTFLFAGDGGKYVILTFKTATGGLDDMKLGAFPKVPTDDSTATINDQKYFAAAKTANYVIVSGYAQGNGSREPFTLYKKLGDDDVAASWKVMKRKEGEAPFGAYDRLLCAGKGDAAIALQYYAEMYSRIALGNFLTENDVATKDELAGYLPRAGGKMTGPITGGDPTGRVISSGGQVSSGLSYVQCSDIQLAFASKKSSNNRDVTISMDTVTPKIILSTKNGNASKSLTIRESGVFVSEPAGTSDTEVATTGYVDSEAAKCLPLAGGTMTGDVKYSADDFRIKASGAEVDAYFDKKGAALEAYGTGISCAMVNVTLGDENDKAPQTAQLVAGKDGSDNNPVMTYLTVTPEDATLTGVGGAAYTPGSDDSIMTKRNVASYVDGAITEGVAAKCEIVVGSYTGEGVGKTRTVTLGFRPKAVIVADNLTRGNYLKPQDVNFAIDGVPSPCVTIIDTGFTVSSYFNGTNSDFGDLNPFRYIAFK